MGSFNTLFLLEKEEEAGSVVLLIPDPVVLLLFFHVCWLQSTFFTLCQSFCTGIYNNVCTFN